jgi:hypothetical protein
MTRKRYRAGSALAVAGFRGPVVCAILEYRDWRIDETLYITVKSIKRGRDGRFI